MGHTGAVTLVQRFANALNANIHFHMRFLDGAYVDHAPGSSMRFRWGKAPSSAELAQLAHAIAQRVGRFLQRRGLLERDAGNSSLAGEALEAEPLDPLLGHSITYRIAVGPQAGRKVFTLQSLPATHEPFDDPVGKEPTPALRNSSPLIVGVSSTSRVARASLSPSTNRSYWRSSRMILIKPPP